MLFGWLRTSRNTVQGKTLFLVRTRIKKIALQHEEPHEIFEDTQIVAAYDNTEASDIYQKYVADMPRKKGIGYHYVVKDWLQFDEILS